MASDRELSCQSPLSGQKWEVRLSFHPDGVPHYSHNEHMPVFFYGGWASSFAPYPFEAPMVYTRGHPIESTTVYPTSWRTREHWFAAHKTINPKVCRDIADADGPWEAKRMGRSRVKVKLVDGWDDGISYAVMLDGIRLQLQRWPTLKGLLLSTGDRFIAEVSPEDAIWGIYDRDTDSWNGKNLLGVAWMEARAELVGQFVVSGHEFCLPMPVLH